MGVGRWTVYFRPSENQTKPAEDERIRTRIDYWHTMLPCSGTRKIAQYLKKEGFDIGRKRIRRLMREMGIYPVYPKPRLSWANKQDKKYPYLLRDMEIWLPNQVWAIDITYIPMGRSHMYLTAIIDWHSRYIVGWVLSDTLDTVPVLEALKSAIGRHGIPGIINSDQGCQFTSEAYTSFLAGLGVRQSMDGKARWVDNVLIERWFRSLKTEDIYINEYNSPKELRKGVELYIQSYNEIRIHQNLDYETPGNVYRAAFVAA